VKEPVGYSLPQVDVNVKNILRVGRRITAYLFDDSPVFY